MEMSSSSSGPRSVKIGDDERLGWSSERPRREGGPTRPADISTRSRVLSPSDALRYAPGSLLVIVSASTDEANAFADRLVPSRGAILSLQKVRGLLQGRVGEAELETRAQELLAGAVAKRLEANETVVLVADSLAAEAREPFVRLAAAAGRPRHVILLEPAGIEVSDDDKAVLTDLRRRLAASELGQEGFQTALRLAGTSIAELKRLDFRPAPRDD
jgi:hypothetical protein